MTPEQMHDFIERLRDGTLSPYRQWELCGKAADEIERLYGVVKDLHSINAEWVADLAKELTALQAREEKLLDFIQNAPVSSGVCCCGECMDRHSNPMSCGHSPTDQWDWSVQCMVEESKKQDHAALNERLAQERERCAKVCEEQNVSNLSLDVLQGSRFSIQTAATLSCGKNLAAAIRAMGDEE